MTEATTEAPEAVAPEAQVIETPETSTAEAPASTEDIVLAAMEKNGFGEKPNGTPNPDSEEPAPEEKTENPAPKVEEKPKAEKPRADDGKFKAAEEKATEQKAAAEPPKADDTAIPPPDRWTLTAKQKWLEADPEVRKEVDRTLTEMQAGLDEYKAERDALKPYRDLAKQHGTTVDKALENYVAAERALHENPVAGLARIAQQYGVDLQAFARTVLGAQEGQADPRDQQIAALSQQVQRLTQGQEQAAQAAAQREQQAQVDHYRTMISDLRAEMPRLDELKPTIARLIDSGVVSGSDDRSTILQAYQAAERLIPAPAPVPAPPAPVAQTRAEATSISGSPSNGSNPRNAPAKDIDEAVNRALSKYGF